MTRLEDWLWLAQATSKNAISASTSGGSSPSGRRRPARSKGFLGLKRRGGAFKPDLLWVSNSRGPAAPYPRDSQYVAHVSIGRQGPGL
jgi:hypothetical protein